MGNPYFKTTKGYNAEVIVAKSVAYTTDADLATFLENAVEGEIGIFNAATNAAYAAAGTSSTPGTPVLNKSATGGALAAATYYVKIVGIKDSSQSAGSTEASVTTTGSTSSISISWPDDDNDSYRVYIGTASDSQDKYFAVADNSFEYTGEAGTAGTVPVASAVADKAAAGDLVFIAQKRDGILHKSTTFKVESGVGTYTDYTAPVADVWTLDTSGVTIAAGTVYEIGIIELTRATQPMHVWNFDYKAKTGDTITEVLTALNAKINDTDGLENYAFGRIATGSNSSGDLVLTAYDAARYFKPVARGGFADVTVTHTTKPKLGSGTYEGVAQLEAEGLIFDGVTTNYPNQNVTPEEFGKPTEFATSGITYDIAIFKPWVREESPLPFHAHNHKKHILVALPSSGTTPKAAFKSIFGF